MLVAIGVMAILTHMIGLIIVSTVSTGISGFRWGIAYRQHVVDTGRCPRQFLRIEGDCADQRRDAADGQK